MDSRLGLLLRRVERFIARQKAAWAAYWREARWSAPKRVRGTMSVPTCYERTSEDLFRGERK